MTEKLTPDYDKSKWMRGEWDDEPDRLDWVYKGFSCFILRNHSGNWCGYVGVPNTHPSYGKDYNDVNVDVHGGLTYADKCSPPICHVPVAGMSDDVWWLGFDTAHSMDVTPCWEFTFGNDGSYKNMDYIINETKHLADQLKEMDTTDA